MTKVTGIKAIERLFMLRKNGLALADAIDVIVEEFDTTKYQVSKWRREHESTMKTSHVKTNKSSVVVSHRSATTRGLNDLNGILFDTVKDLREGKITHKEACAMSSLAGTITNIKKLQFTGLKYAGKASNQGTTVTKLLGQ